MGSGEMRFVDLRSYLSSVIDPRGAVEVWNAHLILEQRGIMIRRVANQQVPLEKERPPRTKIRQFAWVIF